MAKEIRTSGTQGSQEAKLHLFESLGTLKGATAHKNRSEVALCCQMFMNRTKAANICRMLSV